MRVRDRHRNRKLSRHHPKDLAVLAILRAVYLLPVVNLLREVIYYRDHKCANAIFFSFYRHPSPVRRGQGRAKLVVVKTLRRVIRERKTHKHKQICGIVPGPGGCQNYVYVFLGGGGVGGWVVPYGE